MAQKYSKTLSFLLLLFGALPFLALGCMAHPWGDDYMMASLIGEADNIWSFTWEFYHTWSGRAFGILMSGLSPLNQGHVALYPLTICLNILFFYLANGIFFRQLSRVFNWDKPLLITSLFIFLFNGILLSVPQFYFWFASSSMYMLSISFGLLLLSMMMAEKRKTWYVVLIPLLVAGVTMTNEISMAAWMIFLVLYFLIQKKHYTLRKWDYFILIASIIGVIIAVAAPGNFARSGHLPNGFNLLYTAQKAITAAVLLFGYCFQHPGLWMVLLLVLIKAPVAKNEWMHKTPVWVFLIVYLAIPVMLYGLAYFALGSQPAWRIHNVIQYIALLNTLLLALRIKIYLDKRMLLLPDHHLLTSLLVTGLFVLSLSDFTFKNRKDETLTIRNNIPQAIFDLTQAPSYHKAQKERRETLERMRGSTETLYLPGLPVKPKSLFMQDISEQECDFSNNTLERYYTIEEIRLAPKK